MIKFLLFFKFFLLFFFNFNNISADVDNKIIAKIENEIITSYELKNKIKTILFLSGSQLNQESINKTKNQAMKSLIDNKIKKGELTKYNMKILNSKKVDNYILNLSSKYNTDQIGLKKLFLNNNLDFNIYKNEISIEFAWQQLVFNLHKDKINIDKKDIDNSLKQIMRDQKDIEEYNLAEIEIFSENKDDDIIRINEIENQIKEIGFKNTAIKFSDSSSGLEGGELGWISSNALSKDILYMLKNMKNNEVTKPIIQTGSIIFIKLLNKRTIKTNDINLDQIKKNIISSKRNELLNLFSSNYLSKLKNNAFINIK